MPRTQAQNREYMRAYRARKRAEHDGTTPVDDEGVGGTPHRQGSQDLRGGRASLPRSVRGVLGAVEEALTVSVPAWQRELALSLAGEMDEKPSAATARELRTVMEAIGLAGVAEEADLSDDLAARRAARRAAVRAEG